MKKYVILTLMAFTPAFSALAPLHQSIAEIEAILTNPELTNHLSSGNQIREITKIDDGYLLITNENVLKVKFTYDKKGRIGPKKFTIKFIAPMKICE
jgi:hypothetical protein